MALQEQYYVRRETTRADDGVELVFKRYGRAGGQPLLLLHGLAQNHTCYDLPVPGHSLARFFFEREFDVWLANFRNHGPDGFRSGPGVRWDWTVDDYAILDLPAMIEHVRRQTGQRPFVGGHSMGGMATAMYLQGVTYETDAEGRARVVSRPELIASRNRGLAGALLLAAPAVMRWGNPGYLATLFYIAFDTKVLFQFLPRQRLARRFLKTLDRVPVGGRLRGTDRDCSLFRKLVDRVASWSLTKAARHIATDSIWYSSNVDREIERSILLHTTDDACARVLLQFADWIEHSTFRSYDARRSPGGHVYCDHYGAITAPVLIACGEMDRMAPPDTAREVAYAAVSSPDKTMLVFPETGHLDMIHGLTARERVWPLLLAWLRKRAGAGSVP